MSSKEKNIFFTFAFNIGRAPESLLIRTLYCLVNSLEYFKNSYKLIVYTNIDSLDAPNENVQIIDRDITTIPLVYPNNVWWSMSFHKLAIAKEILITQKISPIWIDLDTIVCRNVDSLSELPNFFIQQRLNDITPAEVGKDISIPTNEYIQGNIWKIDLQLLCDLLHLWSTLDVKPYFDTQGLFNLAYHFYGYSSKMNILDKTYINGLEISNMEKLEHPSIDRLISELIMKENKIIHISSRREVQFFSFTFETLYIFFATNAFSRFTDPGIREFFRACGYI